MRQKRDDIDMTFASGIILFCEVKDSRSKPALMDCFSKHKVESKIISEEFRQAKIFPKFFPFHPLFYPKKYTTNSDLSGEREQRRKKCKVELRTTSKNC